MKKATALILMTAILLLFVSCGGEKNRSYDEEEVKAAAEILIIKSQELNRIFWGTGIPYLDDDNYSRGYYYPADPFYLSKLQVESITDLKNMTAEVFSKKYCSNIYKSVFSSHVGDYSMSGYTRYYQSEDYLMVYSQYKPLLNDIVEYMCQQMTVVGSEGQFVKIKVPIKVTRGTNTQEKEIEIKLIEEENGWRIDTPTYAVYYDENQVN